MNIAAALVVIIGFAVLLFLQSRHEYESGKIEGWDTGFDQGFAAGWRECLRHHGLNEEGKGEG